MFSIPYDWMSSMPGYHWLVVVHVFGAFFMLSAGVTCVSFAGIPKTEAEEHKRFARVGIGLIVGGLAVWVFGPYLAILLIPLGVWLFTKFLVGLGRAFH